MKLTAIMLITNSFFANQHGVDVVNKVIQPIKQISADMPLNNQEFQSDTNTITTAAAFCRDKNVLSDLDTALAEVLAFYTNIDGFEKRLADIREETGLNFAEVSVVIDTMISSVKKDMLLKLAEFDAQVLKRGNDLALLEDSQLLRQVANKASRFFSELRTLVTQITVTDVAMTSSFVNENDMLDLSQISDDHFKALSA